MGRAIFAICQFAVFFLIATAAVAQEAYGHSGGSDNHTRYMALAAAFTITVAAFGGALAQSKTASSALEGIARNPEAAGKIMTPMIIALALIESLVIYALVIAFLLQGKI